MAGGVEYLSREAGLAGNVVEEGLAGGAENALSQDGIVELRVGTRQALL